MTRTPVPDVTPGPDHKDPIKTVIEKEGQRYVDEPEYMYPKVIVECIQRVFPGCPLNERYLLGYHRTWLEWKK